MRRSPSEDLPHSLQEEQHMDLQWMSVLDLEQGADVCLTGGGRHVGGSESSGGGGRIRDKADKQGVAE